jgi:hypothetical protein
MECFDADAVSVVNLDGSDPTKPGSMRSVPRLVAYQIRRSTWWGTCCVVSNEALSEMAPYWPSREEAKRRVIEYARNAVTAWRTPAGGRDLGG